ncbi:glycosyltransferase [Ewingella americana]
MFYIVIVSHNNTEYIQSILSELHYKESGNNFYKIIIRDNVNDYQLRNICKEHHVDYMPSLVRKGFAENNNVAVEYLLGRHEISSDDYFLFMNPDAFISKKDLNLLMLSTQVKTPDMFTVDLYLDKQKTKRDPSIRRFPRFNTFICSFMFNRNNTIVSRDTINENSELDWCASSFFGVKVKNFISLGGFDSKYFMYCEDVDFCKRATKLNLKLTYFPQIKAIHLAQQTSHKVFSKNFYWHLSSVIRYSILKPLLGFINKNGH